MDRRGFFGWALGGLAAFAHQLALGTVPLRSDDAITQRAWSHPTVPTRSDDSLKMIPHGFTASSTYCDLDSMGRATLVRAVLRPNVWPADGVIDQCSWRLLSGEALRPSMRYLPGRQVMVRGLWAISDPAAGVIFWEATVRDW